MPLLFPLLSQALMNLNLLTQGGTENRPIAWPSLKPHTHWHMRTCALSACFCPLISVLFVSSGQASPLPTHSWLLPLQVLLAASHGKPLSRQKVPRTLGVVSAAAGTHQQHIGTQAQASAHRPQQFTATTSQPSQHKHGVLHCKGISKLPKADASHVSLLHRLCGRSVFRTATIWPTPSLCCCAERCWQCCLPQRLVCCLPILQDRSNPNLRLLAVVCCCCCCCCRRH
jgi:hypothetical protein